MCVHVCVSVNVLAWLGPHPPSGDGADGLLVDGDELVQHHVGAGEHAVGVQEGVEEIDGEEAQVGEPLQQALHAGVADLQHLARVHHLAEADVHVVAVQAGVRPAGEGRGRGVLIPLIRNTLQYC